MVSLNNKSREIRLTWIIDSLDAGGAENSLVALCPHLRQQGVDLSVITLKPDGLFARDVVKAGARLFEIDIRAGRIRSYRSLVKLIREIEPDLVHTTLFNSDILGRLASFRCSTPCVSSVVNDLYSVGHFRDYSFFRVARAYLADLVTSRLVTRFHAISEASARSFRRRLFVRKENVDVIYRGRDLNRFITKSSQERNQARLTLGLAKDEKAILAVARHVPQKGLDLFIRSCAVVTIQFPGTRFLIAGHEDVATKELHELRRSLGVGIDFIGVWNDVSLLYKAADVVCFPSRYEGFGGVLVEALASGCPIVASDIPTTREISEAVMHKGIRQFPSGDLDALTRVLLEQLQLLQGEALPENADVELLRSHFSTEIVAEKMVSFYRAAAAMESA